MKLLVEFELDESWETYIPDNDEKLKALIKPQLDGVKYKVVENLDLQNVSSSVSKYVIDYVDSDGTANSTVILATSTDQAIADFTKDYNSDWGSIKCI